VIAAAVNSVKEERTNVMPRLALDPVVTTLPTVKVSPRLKRLVDQRIELRAQLSALEATLETIDADLLRDLDRLGGPIATDDWTVTPVESESRHINKEKLLALGVRPTLIAKATTVTPYRYPKVTVKRNGHA
jgi:hypothetical protein